MSALR